MKEEESTEDGPSIHLASIAAGLEKCYAAPSPLTLGKLRDALGALAASFAANPGRAPRLDEIAIVVGQLGLGGLSVAAVSALSDAAAQHCRDDVLAGFTLKQLEEVLSRIARS